VDNVDFAFREGEIISIVGASGSGKTTFAKILLGCSASPPARSSTSARNAACGPRRSARPTGARSRPSSRIPSPPSTSSTGGEALPDCIRIRGLKLSKDESFELMRKACTFVNLKFEELYNKYPSSSPAGRCSGS
jgi:peptide/nickel transport system ATP-binding protein